MTTAEETPPDSPYRPSASHTWQHCALSLQAPPETGIKDAADLGTAAHMLLERCHVLSSVPHAHIGEPMYKGIPVTEEMADAVAHALDYVAAYRATAKGEVEEYSEHRVDPVRMLKGVVEPEEAAGTTDRLLTTADIKTGKLLNLTVIDYKHGMMYVPLEHENADAHVLSPYNPQIMQYLLGAVSSLAQTPETMTIVIIQPRFHTNEIAPVRECRITWDELTAYRDKLRARLRAIKTKPLQAKAGQWCTWCTLYAKCKTARAYALEQAGVEFDDQSLTTIDISSQTLDNETLCRYALAAPMAAKYLDAVVEHAKLALRKGHQSKVAELIQMTGRRKWGAEAAVIQTLVEKWKFKIDEIAPRALVGITAVEYMFRQWLKARDKPLPKVGQPTLPASVAAHIMRNPPTVRIMPKGAPTKGTPLKHGNEFTDAPQSPTTRSKSNARSKKVTR